jgi:LPS sulfotransferase NodH
MAETATGGSGQPSEYLENLQIAEWAWHLPKRGGRATPLALVFGILSMLPNKKGSFSQEGAASLSSSRKESRK